jgi:hypothetical protein
LFSVLKKAAILSFIVHCFFNILEIGVNPIFIRSITYQ